MGRKFAQSGHPVPDTKNVFSFALNFFPPTAAVIFSPTGVDSTNLRFSRNLSEK
jgi:hypothetical protein